MKRYLLTGLVVIMAIACQNNSAPKDDAAKAKKRTELESLQKQQAEIEVKIKALETELDDKKVSDKTLVKTTALAPSTFQHYLSLQGMVESETSVNIAPQVGGTITNVYVKKGDAVTAGQILARLDNSVTLANIETLKEELALRKTIYERQKNLWDQKVGSEVAYLQAKTAYDAQQKTVDAYQQQADLSIIKAPLSGIMDEVSAKTGQIAIGGFPLFTIVNLNNLKVTANIAENYLGKVKVGDPVTIKFPSVDKEVSKPISSASRVIDKMNRSFGIEIQLNGEFRDALSPNMVADLKVKDYEKADALVVPSNLVQLGDDGDFVYVAVNEGGKDIVKKKMVKCGLTYDNKTEILGGLQKGDILITTGYQDLNEGQELAIENN